jgi:hypothetical protein
MPDGRERHVQPAFGDQDLGGVNLAAGDRAQQLDHMLAGVSTEAIRSLRFWIAASSISMCASSCATMTLWCSIWKRLAIASRSYGIFWRMRYLERQ